MADFFSYHSTAGDNGKGDAGKIERAATKAALSATVDRSDKRSHKDGYAACLNAGV